VLFGRSKTTRNNVPAVVLADLAEYGVTWVTMSNMPLAQIEAYKDQMGWTVPFVSSRGTSFSDDCRANSGFMLSVSCVMARTSTGRTRRPPAAWTGSCSATTSSI
jgi:predicted dithiol-disulfide oxidoreductase (DUF899 family)